MQQSQSFPTFFYYGVTHVMIVACPLLAFVFMLLLILMPSSLLCLHMLHLVPVLLNETLVYTISYNVLLEYEQDGQTAFYVACNNSHLPVVQLLSQKHVDMSTCTENVFYFK